MTGYAYRECQEKDYSISVEFRGCNNRFLDISISLPAHLSSLEQQVRELITKTCVRGRIDVTIHYRELNAPFTVRVNHAAALAYDRAFRTLAEALRIDEKPDLGLLIGLEGVLEIEQPRDTSRCWDRLEPLLNAARKDFDRERSREGEHTRKHILSQISLIETFLDQINTHADEIEIMVKENLRGRFVELLGDMIDESRILAETAVMLIKYTISEEITRLRSHLSEFRAEVERNPSPGKKLDFLCQEMNREINTIGSKTPQIEVSQAVIEMKHALENVREQLRNVE
jgi:uncharacterized protein (TIGR00255 family)